MKKQFTYLVCLTVLCLAAACNSPESKPEADAQFSAFETRFLDAYWKQYPAGAIMNGYGKYYENLPIPDSAGIADCIHFSDRWLDSLKGMSLNSLNDNNKISYHIIENQLQSDRWYRAEFKQHEWDPSVYNISGECDYIINQPYADLDRRLSILSQHIAHADAFYDAAFHNLKQPTKEHLDLAILQNEGGLSLFGKSLTDSIAKSGLKPADRDTLNSHIKLATEAIKNYVARLKTMRDDPKTSFRDFSIGKALFTEKFKYDLATDLTPEQVYEKANADKAHYHQDMIAKAKVLWPKYYAQQPMPADSLAMVQLILDKIQLQHARPQDFFDSLTHHVYRLKKFVVEKQLFDFDTSSPPIKVRIMPEYARGFSVASAEFTPAYQKSGTTYYNIDDLSAYPPDKAESALREYNNYASQLLSIHEAVPGHCVQGIYNNKKSPDVLRAVFQNGAMIEGWAVYTETMMIENGWGDHAPEMELVLDKLKLRELANVIIDYDIQCLKKPKDSILHLLVKECFQTEAQAGEKYHRATVSQVQLCSYYTGATAIMALREDYKKKMGSAYSLKDFHEKFLSFGSSPVKYIRERMMH